MTYETHRALANGNFWFVVYDAGHDPLIVSPAIYETEDLADAAAISQLDDLRRIYARRVA